MPFVPESFIPPAGLDHPAFRLRPLGPEHNASDHAAWSASIDHIRATPGFEEGSWPRPKTLAENLQDLVGHADDFAARTGFTYTVLASGDDVLAPGDETATVIGCVYIYPSEQAACDAHVSSWVRAANADLDTMLYRVVARWLDDAWPFDRVEYAVRPQQPRRVR